MKHVFIINPAAGKNDSSAELIPLIQQAGKTLGIEPVIEVTTHPHHAAEIAQKYADSKEPCRLYACGGDGTLNELLAASVCCDTIAVGCVPCGSGNDYIRNFGNREDFLDMAAQMQGETAKIDVIHSSVGYCIAICAAGLDAKVAYGIPKFRRIPFCGGSMAYTLSIIQVLFSHLGSQLEITIDGTTVQGEYMMMALCNGQLYGGGYCAGPLARMDDGVLDVVLVKPLPRAKIPGFLKLYKVGAHLNENAEVAASLQPYMQYCRAKKIHIRVMQQEPLIVTVDGECSPQKELDVELLPKSLNIVLPTTLKGRASVITTVKMAESHI